MSLIYGLVSRGAVVLAEHSCSAYGNFVPVSRIILERIPAQDARMSYSYDKYDQTTINTTRVHRMADTLSVLCCRQYPDMRSITL
jgi:hypothetical protein